MNSDGKRHIGKGDWIRVGKGGTGKPCEICEGPDYCSVSEDGTTAWCMRTPNDHPKESALGTGYIHKLKDTPHEFHPIIRTPTKRKPTDSERHVKLAPLCRAWFVRRGDAIERLAVVLGVAPWALDLLHVGWNADERCWTFPEQNHLGQIVGCNRRFEDGSKRGVFGGGRGLSYAEYWLDYRGPIFIVEGGSDVAAGLTLGLCAVGRPSNTGGVCYLAKLIGATESDRRAIILAERDEKDRSTLNDRHPSGCQCCGQCYPGKFGAIQTSIALSRKLDRIVEWSFLPDGAKDLRGWLNGKQLDPTNETAMKRLSASLIRRIGHGIKI